jgi:hypothetical protein
MNKCCFFLDITVQFAEDAIVVAEDIAMGRFQVCVDASSANFAEDIEIMLSYSSITAQGIDISVVVLLFFQVSLSIAIIMTEGSDYVMVEPTLVFSGTSMAGDAMLQECFSVDIVDDSVYEDLETFTITMSSMNPRVEFTQPVLTVSITDNDSECSYSHPLLFHLRMDGKGVEEIG